MSQLSEFQTLLRRREFLQGSLLGLGSVALGSLFGCANETAPEVGKPTLVTGEGLGIGQPHFAPKARRVIYLFQSGGPSQMELFDYKPLLNKWHGQEIPPSVLGKNRVSGMVSNQYSFPLAGAAATFARHRRNGTYVIDLLPHTAKIIDELCVVKSVHTEQINHEPTMMFMQTGNQISGRPCIGSWLSYGLGSLNQNLPTFIVMLSKGGGDQPINSAAWSNGFLASHYQGVQFMNGHDPVLYLSTPEGVDRADRRRLLDAVGELNRLQQKQVHDPEIESRINQYEMAYRMQTAVPDVADISNEPDRTFDLYGADARQPGTFAHNCLLARRLAEKDVRFIQLYHCYHVALTRTRSRKISG
jgi:hypothetical protein